MSSTDISGVVHIGKQGTASVLEYTSELVGNLMKDEVLVRQKVIVFNSVDVLLRNRSFPLNHFPSTLGVEAGGIVEAIGTGVFKEIKPTIYPFLSTQSASGPLSKQDNRFCHPLSIIILIKKNHPLYVKSKK